MVSHVLDRPVWNSLATSHARLAQGDQRARRYPPAIVPFGAAADSSAGNLDALAALLGDGEVMAIVEAGEHEAPSGLEIVLRDNLVQMVAKQTFPRIQDSRIVPLTPSHAEDMLALATLTKPGPFTLGAQELGTFWGVFIDGRLAAMAGQRLRVPGFGELSGLCTHPDFQGQGLGRLLFNFVAGEISARGDTVFLHAFASNTHAISLYERLGMTLRSSMHLLVVQREGGT